MPSRLLAKLLFGGVLVILALGIVLVSNQLAQAGSYTLTNWNKTELDSTDDYVQVLTGPDCDPVNTNKICVQWFEGSTVEGPAALGIDTFFYDKSTTNGENVPKISSVSGNTSSWTFNFDGTQANAVSGGFDSKKSLGSGDDGGISAPLIFTMNEAQGVSSNTNVLDTDVLAEFAVHVRFDNGCSGWVSNRSVTTITSDANCGGGGGGGGGPVPEPSTLALLGSGLLVSGITLRLRRGTLFA